MPTAIEPIPIDAPMVDAPRMTISSVWYRYLSAAIIGRLQTSAHVTRVITRAQQAAAIGATALSTGGGGIYEVGWVLRVVQAATVSSSCTVTIANTDGGVNVSQSGAAVTGNTTATTQSGAVRVRADPATPITFAVAYASVGAVPMQYTITVWIETVNV